MLGRRVVADGGLRSEHALAQLLGESVTDAVVRGLCQAIGCGRVLLRRPRQVPAMEQRVAERDAQRRTGPLDDAVPP